MQAFLQLSPKNPMLKSLKYEFFPQLKGRAGFFIQLMNVEVIKDNQTYKSYFFLNTTVKR